MATYSIENDVAEQKIDTSILHQEILDSGFVTDYSGIVVSGDTIEVRGIVNNHVGLATLISVHSVRALPRMKAEKITNIDTRTREIIADGFTFDANQFSLSQQAQTNWLGLITLQSFFTWPVGITNNADATYNLELANLPAFIGTGSGTIAQAIGSGRALKIAANAAITLAELDAVVDTR